MAQIALPSSGLARNKTRIPPVEFTHISKSLMVRDPWDGPQINLRARFHGQLPTMAQTKYMGRETPGPRKRKISYLRIERERERRGQLRTTRSRLSPPLSLSSILKFDISVFLGPGGPSANVLA